MKDSWFFGNSGLKRLKEINDSFKHKALYQINSTNKCSFKNYSPWMSNYSNHLRLKNIYELNEKIVTSNEALNAIESQYYPPEDKNNFVSFSTMEETELGLIKAASDKVMSSYNDISLLFDELVMNIVPMKTTKGNFQDIGIGFSSHLAKGAIFLSIPFLELNSVNQLAINIAHETGHQALYVYQTADPIIENGLSTPVYSFVRKTDRPAIQSFHATIALAFMVRFISQLPESDESEYLADNLNVLSSDFKKSLDSYGNVTFTEFGKILLDDLRCYANEI
ncbi:MAG: hypothetical protein CL676_11235 [Bdellovibrionaceae bacterium]|nr:hypothetical protein [Pseudobdellovibrionaceae bacterium]|tara:strand:- start:14372 stop:15211 length:840 start_codon:yes stop_codon:yes gene_type:complete